MFGVATADVAAGEIEDLRAEITRLLVQIKALEACPDEIIVEHLTDVPEFEHVAVGWDGEYPEGNFVYYRPVIWESFGDDNFHGRYDHSLEVLHLQDEVESLSIILDDRVIIVRYDGTITLAGSETVVGPVTVTEIMDPVTEIMNSPAQFSNLLHDQGTDVLADKRSMRDHIKSYGFPGKGGSDGFYPRTGHDLVVRVGDNLVGIIFPAGQKMERHRQVRLMMLGDGAVSLHGYPSGRALGFLREGFENYAELVQTTTEALGYLVISEIVRDLTLLVHETVENATQGFGAPSAHPGPVQSLVKRTQALLSGTVTPEGKKLTTWGTLKQ